MATRVYWAPREDKGGGWTRTSWGGQGSKGLLQETDPTTDVPHFYLAYPKAIMPILPASTLFRLSPEFLRTPSPGLDEAQSHQIQNIFLPIRGKLRLRAGEERVGVYEVEGV